MHLPPDIHTIGTTRRRIVTSYQIYKILTLLQNKGTSGQNSSLWSISLFLIVLKMQKQPTNI